MGISTALALTALLFRMLAPAGCPPDWRDTPCPAESRQALEGLTAGREASMSLTPAQFQALVRCLVADPSRAVLAGLRVEFAPGEFDAALRLRHILAWPICLRMRWHLEEDGAGRWRWACQEMQVGRLKMPAFLCALLSRQVSRWWGTRIAPGWDIQRLELSRGLVKFLGRRR
ncbi:MAG: hypothetical protein ACP5TV_03095 [Anaerolineae bacterium]